MMKKSENGIVSLISADNTAIASNMPILNLKNLHASLKCSKKTINIIESLLNI